LAQYFAVLPFSLGARAFVLVLVRFGVCLDLYPEREQKRQDSPERERQYWAIRCDFPRSEDSDDHHYNYSALVSPF